ncbi:hypothetical protein [Glutamicibacter halophytocola]|uniref:hypothetical protein n=1 Tax=Glutamicibacter halophytocola TaxID=1933880 RepID=UPI0015C5829F|nr:hypothetical protein [Glutamicibacter halophytocola]NQD42379.1 hypothetical protein [Glutamicibacter halophytocola]
MKATSKTTAPVQVTKEPKMVMLREVVPWFIVAIMAFAVAGTITGWFLRSDVAKIDQTYVAVESKAQSR